MNPIEHMYKLFCIGKQKMSKVSSLKENSFNVLNTVR